MGRESGGDAAGRLRRVPATGTLLAQPALAALVARFGHPVVAQAVRHVLAAERARLRRGGRPRPPAQLLAAVDSAVRATVQGPLRRVVNGTGVILHTNLGRAPLSAAAATAVAEIAAGYSSLELDLATGRRRDRRALLETLLCQATGAEAATVANNGAAALLLALTSLCHGRAVLVSRGEAIEIGGGFRIPELLACSGARLVDVGTTNRTRVDDYRRATDQATAAWLRVHPSNFRIEGFAGRPGTGELAVAAHAAGVLLLVDAGSGLVYPAAGATAAEEAMPAALAAGADLVLGSGDKLLGAGQVGIAAGGRALVDRLARHPLARALRPDKLQLAALQATLLAHVTPGRLRDVPVWRMLGLEPAELRRRVDRWVEELAAAGIAAETIGCEGAVGGGTTPGPGLPSFGLRLAAARPERLRARLLAGEPPVLVLSGADGVTIDARTVLPGEDAQLLGAIRAASGRD
ncbi:MAG TPA: L-seryl-tRNA(Sec) selenium transferase [Candidatus Micrarchaeia archaeon]|nr:L-seryl-tRNA(Sec) selenium transferase [Candidatus Micrarchaeia archaeon]